MKMERASRMARRKSSGDSREVDAAEVKGSEEELILTTLSLFPWRDGARRRLWLSPTSPSSLNLEHQKSDVIILRPSGIGAGPTAQLQQKGIGKLASGGGGRGHELFEAHFAKLFACCVHGFGDSIGVEEEAIA